MRITQAHSIQPVGNPARQNAHINSELIKNNQQSQFTQRSRQSPSHMVNNKGVSYQPIEIVNNSNQDRNNISFGQPYREVNQSANLNLMQNTVNAS